MRTVASTPAWLVRSSARVPKAAFIIAMAILSVAGLASVLRGAPERVASLAAEPTRDLTAESFAEAFTRAYLTWDAARPERHERAVAVFTSETLGSGAGLSVPARGSQRVTWTATVRDEAVSPARRLVTVAVQTSTGRAYYVSVPVDRTGRGLFAVRHYPALVGALAADSDTAPADDPDVEDSQLRTVVARVITNYLRRDRTNLRADLDERAVIALPPSALDVRSIDSISRLAPGRVAVELRAEGRGGTWTLRYELEVVKARRWYVRSIQTNPTERKSR